MNGSCLCGKVQYRIKAFIPHTTHCHCSMCRKFHGAAYATFAVAKTDEIVWLSGKSDIKTYQAPNGTLRSFCQHCGSSLTFADKNHPETTDIALGTLDDTPDQFPEAHIFVGSKAPWSIIDDGLPLYNEGHDLE